MASNSSHHGGATTTIASVHSDIIETHILTKLDGPSLASAASTCQQLHAPSSNENLWKDICDSTWTSVNHPRVRQAISTIPGGYRSYFSHSFPRLRPNHHPRPRHHRQFHTSELISAIDIHYENKPVFSKVIVTNTDKESFLKSTFGINLLDPKETVKMPLKFEGDENECMLNLEKNMTFSWILIDPTGKRVANVSSLRPVIVQPYGGESDIEVTYATIVSGECDDNTSEFVECRVLATFRCEEGRAIEMREGTLHVEDTCKGCLNGEKSLGILEEAMESGERKKGNGGEESERYAKYLDLKRKRKEEMKRREGRLDMVSRVLWAIHLLALVVLASCFRYGLVS